MAMATQEIRTGQNNGGGGGCSPCLLQPKSICRAWKEMKTKVATHTGVSLSFVELVSTSPAVGLLLPAMPASPRSPSALLHRRMLQINGKSHYLHDQQKSVQPSPSPAPSSVAPQTPRRSSCSSAAPAASPVLRHHSIVTRLAVFLLSLISRLLAAPRCYLGRLFRRNSSECSAQTVAPAPSTAPPVPSPMSTKRHLKTKLRSSFRTLSVQVPRKAFAPLHLNTPSSLRSPSRSPSHAPSSLTSRTPSSSPSPLSTPSLSSVKVPSPATTKTPYSGSAAKPWSYYTGSPTQSPSPLFLNQNQNQSLAMSVSPSPCPRKPKFSHNKPRKSSIISGLVCVVLALAGLHVSKIVAGVVVVVWLLFVSITVSLSVRIKSWRAATCS